MENDVSRGKFVANFWRNSIKHWLFRTFANFFDCCCTSFSSKYPKKPLSQLLFKTNSKDCNFSRTDWAKVFCSFPFQPLNYQEKGLSNFFWKTPRVPDILSHCTRRNCIVISLVRFICVEKKILIDNMIFWRSFVSSIFFLFEQETFILRFLLAFYAVGKQFQRKRFWWKPEKLINY